MKIFRKHLSREVVIILTLKDFCGFIANEYNEDYYLFESFIKDNYKGVYTECGNYSDYLYSILERWMTPLFISKDLNYLSLTFSNVCPVKEVLLTNAGLDREMDYINLFFEEITIEKLNNYKYE